MWSSSGGPGIDTKGDGAAPGASRLLETYAVHWVCGLNTYVQSPLVPRILRGVPGRAKPTRLSAMSGCPRSEASPVVTVQIGPPIGLRSGQSSVHGGPEPCWADAVARQEPTLSTADRL